MTKDVLVSISGHHIDIMAEPEETPETPDTPATTVDAPKTGDHTPIAALMISCGLGLAGAIAAAVWMKVRKKKRD